MCPPLLDRSSLHSLEQYPEEFKMGNSVYSLIYGRSECVITATTSAPSRISSSLIKSIWKRFSAIFTTPQTPKDCVPSITAISGHNADMITHSEPQGEIVHPNISSTSEEGEPVREAISNSSSDMQPELLPESLVPGSHIDPIDEQSTSDGDSFLDDDYNNYDDYNERKYRCNWVSESARQEEQELITYFQRSTLPRITISVFTETGQVEALIKVPKQ